MWLLAGTEECVQVTSGSGVRTEGTAALDLGMGGWAGPSPSTLNETCWQLSRLEINLLKFQAYLGSSEGSVWG